MSSILLVRHGQASFGAADYDNLSDTGHEQSRVLGAALAARGVAPDVVVAGEMRRHRQTAAVTRDDAADHGQAQAAPSLLGGDEGFEELDAPTSRQPTAGDSSA